MRPDEKMTEDDDQATKNDAKDDTKSEQKTI